MAGQRLTDKTALEQQTGSGDLFMVVDVNDTTGSAAGTSKKIDAKFIMQTDKFSLSNAEIQALNTSPKTFVSALSGYMIQVYHITILTTYASATESSSNNLMFGYEDNDSFYWEQVRDIMNGKTTSITYSLAADPAASGTCETSILNKPL